MGFAGLCTMHHMTTAETANFVALCSALSHKDNPLALSVLDPTTGNMLEHCQLQRNPQYKTTWDTLYPNELGRLCQGIGSGEAPHSKCVAGTDTFFCINYHNIQLHKRKETCHTMVVSEVHPDKEDPNRTRITIGGSCICYLGNTVTNTASLELLKLLRNSVLSRKGACLSSIDLKNFYLDTPMPEPDYVCIKILDIPNKFIDKYKITGLDQDGWIYFEIYQGCYGRLQAGILANDLLCSCLEVKDFYEVALALGLWCHKWRPIQYCLIIDNFGVKYVGLEHFNYLLSILKKFHGVQYNMAGDKFAGMDIEWNRAARCCHISLPGYISMLLLKFKYPHPAKPRLSPCRCLPIACSAKSHITPDPDSSELLHASCKRLMQEIVGSLLYYARAVDNKLLIVLSTITACQAKATVATEQVVELVLDYVATYPNDGIVYCASNMILCVHADAGFLKDTNSCSRAGAHIYLSEDDPFP
jgi:hypothetical protein